MTELLADETVQQSGVERHTLEVSVQHDWGSYKLKLRKSIVGNHEYVDFAEVERIIHR